MSRITFKGNIRALTLELRAFIKEFGEGATILEIIKALETDQRECV